MSGDVAVKVVDGTQVHHDGRTYEAGQRLELPLELADRYQAAGWVQPASGSRPAKK